MLADYGGLPISTEKASHNCLPVCTSGSIHMTSAEMNELYKFFFCKKMVIRLGYFTMKCTFTTIRQVQVGEIMIKAECRQPSSTNSQAHNGFHRCS